MTVKFYADRDAMELDSVGGYYCKHVNAMTIESLHRKGDIAAELGWRDMQIDTLKAELDEARGQLVNLAVENAELKTSQSAIYDYTHHFTNSDDREMWNAMHDIYKLSSPLQTPATDAAIANWQAQGVEKFAQKFCESTNMDFACNRGFYKGALEFAVSLRKGATDEQ